MAVRSEKSESRMDGSRYPLDPKSIGEDTYVVISRGHHDIHAFMTKVRENWSWPLGVPEHIWMKTMPAPTPEYVCRYTPVSEGTRGAWPCTYVREAYNEDSYEAQFPHNPAGGLAPVAHAQAQES